MSALHDEAVRALLADWIEARCFVIGEISGSLTRDYAQLADDAKARAELIGVAWSDDLLPDWLRDQLAWVDPDDG